MTQITFVNVVVGNETTVELGPDLDAGMKGVYAQYGHFVNERVRIAAETAGLSLLMRKLREVAQEARDDDAAFTRQQAAIEHENAHR